MTLEEALTTAVVALSGVIIYFEKRQRQASIRQREADDRNAALAERVGRVEGQQRGIERLSADTLELVRQAKACRYEPGENTNDGKSEATA